MSSFCYHPWAAVDISPQGDFKPCCKYVPKNKMGTTFDEYNKSIELYNLRSDFLEGKRPEGCARCWRDEDAGLPSKRELDWKYTYKEQVPDPKLGLRVLSLAFGNTCNLACRVCSSYSSSRWIKEGKRIEQYVPIKTFGHATFYEDPAWFNDLLKRCNNLIHIDIPGGEPFLKEIKQHQQFLEWLLGNAKTLPSLHYTTNGTTQLSPAMEQLLAEFPKVNIQLSIDGVGEKFEYQRWPAKWDMVYENIQYFKKLSHAANFELSISHTVSIFNVLDVENFIQWCEDEQLPAPYIGLVSSPAHYSISSLPEYMEKQMDVNFNISNNTNMFDTFLKHVKLLDNNRKQSFPSTFPELWALMSQQDKDYYINL